MWSQPSGRFLSAGPSSRVDVPVLAASEEISEVLRQVQCQVQCQVQAGIRAVRALGWDAVQDQERLPDQGSEAIGVGLHAPPLWGEPRATLTEAGWSGDLGGAL